MQYLHIIKCGFDCFIFSLQTKVSNIYMQSNTDLLENILPQT